MMQGAENWLSILRDLFHSMKNSTSIQYGDHEINPANSEASEVYY